MSTKGQVIIPADIREDMKLTPGTKYSVRFGTDHAVTR